MLIQWTSQSEFHRYKVQDKKYAQIPKGHRKGQLIHQTDNLAREQVSAPATVAIVMDKGLYKEFPNQMNSKCNFSHKTLPTKHIKPHIFRVQAL